MFLEKIPPILRNEFQSLTTKDILVLIEFGEEIPKFSSLSQIRQALKEKSPKLESFIRKKMLKAAGFLSLKRAQLKSDTVSALRKAGELSKNYTKQIIELVKKQSPEVKSNFNTVFPRVSELINSPLFTKFVEYVENRLISM
jgi:hypothetical protein